MSLLAWLKILRFYIFLIWAFTEPAKPVCRGRKEFLPIEETEYLSVSDLIRGRAKLQDVSLQGN